MACKLDFSKISEEQRNKMCDDLYLKIESDNRYSFNKNNYQILEIFEESKQNNIDYIHIPFFYGYNVLKFKKPKLKNYPRTNIKFEGSLRQEQKIVKKESIDYLNKFGCVTISMYTGGGKTATSINISCTIKLKTLVIVNRIILMKQWEQSISKFCPNANIQKLTNKTKFDNNADFYIINATNVIKRKNEFNEIGCVIVDEAHIILAKTLSASLLHIFPKYVLALTATPYRPDGLNILFDYYFGKHKIIRELNRKHIVYKVNTGFTPVTKLTIKNKINWGSLLDSQANDIQRNQIIIDIVTNFKDRIGLIITKRTSQGQYLYDKLLDLNENVDTLLGKKQDFNNSCRILIGTSNKLGVGFDFPELDMIILGGDIEEYFIQYLGRAFRRLDVVPIIFDLVDNNRILEKHFKTREEVYKRHGGTIKIY